MKPANQVQTADRKELALKRLETLIDRAAALGDTSLTISAANDVIFQELYLENIQDTLSDLGYEVTRQEGVKYYDPSYKIKWG